jgi:hypothetical protein
MWIRRNGRLITQRTSSKRSRAIPVPAAVGIEDKGEGSLGAGRLCEPSERVQRRLHQQTTARVPVHQVAQLMRQQRHSHRWREDDPERNPDESV